MFDLIAFDGDDTLWHNERLYQMGRQRFRNVLERYGYRNADAEIDSKVHQTEMQNLQYFGYGVMSFVLSLIEASIDLTGGRISGADLRDLLGLAKEMLTAEVHLFEGVAETLSRIAGEYTLMLITKGDLLHQQAKVSQSGLKSYFRYVEVVSDKSQETYESLLSKHSVRASRFMMVGNSMRSDIQPVLCLGGWAVHVPALLSWSHEDIEAPGDLGNRYFELTSLAQLPALLESLGGSTRQTSDRSPA